MAYSPLGSSAPKFSERHGCILMNHPVIKDIAASVGKSPSQVLIRWSLQKGFVSIPKSANPDRIAQNGDVFAWQLVDVDMQKIDALNSNFRYFFSYLKKPDNDIKWHDGVLQ